MKKRSRLKQIMRIYQLHRAYNYTYKVIALIIINKATHHLLFKYGHNQVTLNPDEVFDEEGIFRNKQKINIESQNTIAKNEKFEERFIWVIPNCTNIWGGGHYTLFRFINFFYKEFNVKSTIFIYNHNDGFKCIKELESELNHAFSTDCFSLEADSTKLPIATVAIATTWQSAYFVRQLIAKNKFYFMQDYESLFYAAGTSALQANYTYSFGFKGITGGHWLKQNYESYGSKAQEYIFSADRNVFYPQDNEDIISIKVKKIFFYGRPSTERRAFALGINALNLIAQKYPDIEIIIAGLDGLAKPDFKCTLLGNLNLKQTGELYRTCDIGIALSATNMSYLPVELMASGCPVVSNKGPQVEWYCINEFNALLTEPTPSAILEAIDALVESYDLRKRLATNGLRTIEKTTWEHEMTKIYHYITDISSPVKHDARVKELAFSIE